MASTDRSLPVLPFGMARPSERDLGQLGRELIGRAAAEVAGRRRRSLTMLLPCLGLYLVYAVGVGVVLMAVDVELPPVAFVALHTVGFLVMAALGQHYSSEATWASLQGMGRLHRVLLVQAFIVRALTAAFFLLPRFVVRTVAHLFPRPPQVDRNVLHVAVHLAVALDEPVAVDDLVRILPGVAPAVVDEAVLLLEWADLAAGVTRGGRRVVLPGPRREYLVLGLGLERGAVVRVSDLRGPTSPGSGARLGEVDAVDGEPPAGLRLLREKPLHVLGAVVGAGLVLAAAWGAGWAWYRRLPVTVESVGLPLVGVDGLSRAGDRYLLGRGGEVRVTADLDATPTTSHPLVGLHRVWADRGGGLERATGDDLVSFDRVDLALPDPGGRHLLVDGRWRYDLRRSGSPSGFAVVDLEARVMMPVGSLEVGAYSAKGWWDAGRLLAVRGGGSSRSDNLAPELVAVEVRSGRTTSLHRPAEGYFALAGEEGGRRVFLGARRQGGAASGRTAFRLTEYQELRPVRGFTATLVGRELEIGHAELDARGDYWVLAVEEPPPPVLAAQGSTHALWLVARRGGRWRRVVEGEREGLVSLMAMPFRGRSALVLTRDREPTELEALAIVE